MQDSYTGDIGDYGKYGLLKEICKADLSLSVNWYRVIPKKLGKQDDGKFINYLTMPHIYREYDSQLFDALKKIVIYEEDRRLERIERENLFPAVYYSKPLDESRSKWHSEALEKMKNSAVVFLDPDNGLETERMHKTNKATIKHVKWTEVKDYYERGQNIILYQHRPQMTKRIDCIGNIMYFQQNYLFADCVKMLEFPKYTNRYYFMFLHTKYINAFEQICNSMVEKWGKNDFCKKVILA